MARCLDVNKFGLFPGQLGVFFFGGPGKRSKYPVRSSFQVPQERKWRALSNYQPQKKTYSCAYERARSVFKESMIPSSAPRPVEQLVPSGSRFAFISADKLRLPRSRN